jgi:uncharacterized membrane protein
MRPLRFFHPLLARPALTAATIVLAIALVAMPWGWRASTRAILSWDAAILVFLIMIVRLMSRTVDAHTMALRSRRLDEGRGAILIISMIGAAASIAAVCLEIAANKVDKGEFQHYRIALMIATVALSWVFVQTVFAVHYAHDYYMPEPEPKKMDLVTDDFPPEPDLRFAPKPANIPYRCGLQFPGGDWSPDYWDFFHFSVIIGAACQTADVTITSKEIRRIVTAHSIIAFVFNAIILGLTINLSASLF